jgi:hypothetical protein
MLGRFGENAHYFCLECLYNVDRLIEQGMPVPYKAQLRGGGTKFQFFSWLLLTWNSNGYYWKAILFAFLGKRNS